MCNNLEIKRRLILETSSKKTVRSHSNREHMIRERVWKGEKTKCDKSPSDSIHLGGGGDVRVSKSSVGSEDLAEEWEGGSDTPRKRHPETLGSHVCRSRLRVEKK